MNIKVFRFSSLISAHKKNCHFRQSLRNVTAIPRSEAAQNDKWIIVCNVSCLINPGYWFMSFMKARSRLTSSVFTSAKIQMSRDDQAHRLRSLFPCTTRRVSSVSSAPMFRQQEKMAIRELEKMLPNNRWRAFQ